MLQAPPITITRVDLARLRDLLASPAQRDSDAAEALAEEIDRAEVVEPTELPPDVVSMHSKVRLREKNTSRTFELTLVYPTEAGEGCVSVLAPIGCALLGLAVGREIEWPLPGGQTARIEVQGLLYQPEAAGLDLH